MQLYCPKCSEPSANIDLYLHTPGTFKCCECDDEFTAEDVRETLADIQRKWGPMLAWVEQMPTDEDENATAAKK